MTPSPIHIGIGIGLIVALAGTLVAVGVIIPELGQSQQLTSAATTATLNDGDTRIQLTALNNASYVTVSTATTYGQDPRTETPVGRLNTVGDTLTVPDTASKTVLVRSHEPSRIVVSNVYQHHTETQALVDLYGNHSTNTNTLYPSATLAIDQLTNTTYRVTRVLPTPGFYSATSNNYRAGIDQVETLTITSASTEPQLFSTTVGDSTVINITDYEDNSLTIVGMYKGEKSVITALDERELQDCSLNSTNFTTPQDGGIVYLDHCQTTSR